MNTSNYPEEKKFEVRTYGFMELAMLYNPDLQPTSAANALRRWIHYNPKLISALEEVGWRKGQRKLTPLQTEQVRRFLGEP
ncbi:DUF4248 domain-containing protein [uncultured Parabacteroides sp.]|uniref:DUF4248 domain-containing protein n=1 Tax=uncultured Parabacteroides sp. TaxID=512312 RepID=UPI0025E0E7EC|nr:DUF4248 domain-containing protein [uncultured Parabacteroides sp.]